MGRFKNLSGQVFGRLTGLERTGTDKGGNALWKCLCECGNTVVVRSYDLLNGNTKSCGCLQRQLMSERRSSTLIGKFFERLLVQKRKGSDKYGKALWECLCECGKIVIVSSNHLLNGNTKSCGCLRKEKLSGKNNCNWRGGITPENRRIRCSYEYKVWRAFVFERDNYTCQHCGQRGGTLHADHIKKFADHKELRLTVDNGRTLCVACHKKTDTYGSHKDISI